MNTCFISPININGKVSRTVNNLSVVSAWPAASDSDIINVYGLAMADRNQISQQYDLGVIILPKDITNLNLELLLTNARKLCKKIGHMQEGSHWYYQDYKYVDQIRYLNFVGSMDVLFAHSKTDVPYYSGIYKKKTYTIQTLIVDDGLKAKNITPARNGEVIIGGNFCSWYSGIDSYFVARNFNKPIWVPSMGRRIENEEHTPNLNHLPFLEWTDWMIALSKFSYGVHLMRPRVAGTFALNCSYWGIPCIGYKGLDTQQILHPDLSVDVGDIESANKLAIRLRDDKEFYNQCVETTKTNYQKYYTEQVWLKHWREMCNDILENT